MKKKNYWLLIILMDITIGFIALSPKGEINNLSLWMIVPHVFSYFILIFLTKLQHFFVEKKEKKKCLAKFGFCSFLCHFNFII